ncbi:MAG: hypothetical protein ACOY71_05335 [Gemmatimonadota bacterium]
MTAKSWISIIQVLRRRACVDAAVPSAGAGRPIFAAQGDTLLVLDQVVTSGGQGEAWIRRYAVEDGDCDWLAMPGHIVRSEGA